MTKLCYGENGIDNPSLPFVVIAYSFIYQDKEVVCKLKEKLTDRRHKTRTKNSFIRPNGNG